MPVCALSSCKKEFKIRDDGDRPGFRVYCSDAHSLEAAMCRFGLTERLAALQDAARQAEAARAERRERALAVPLEAIEERRARMASIRPQRSSQAPVEKPGSLPLGTRVRYLGGSKAAWLVPGAVGIITHHHGDTTLRYGLKFDERATVLASTFVEKET